jgi:glucose/arabinose dehydrogenase
VVASALWGAACDQVSAPPAGRPGLELVAVGLTRPLFATAPPADTQRVFVVGQDGRVHVLRNDTLLTRPYLDLRPFVTFSGEQGLLGMAVHPRYAQNGYTYLHYTNTEGDGRIVRYRVTQDPDSADPLSGDTVLRIDHRNIYHQGGMLAFGPDGFLYVALGDDGAPVGARDLRVMTGKILRLEVDAAHPYAIPPSNPFVGRSGALPEIWASGLRNPWRMSFDRANGDLYIGDVGQLSWEEIDVQPAGSSGGDDYGWFTMEGTHCFEATTCDQTGIALPMHEYSHTDGCAVIGGYVYRGEALKELAGRYLYSDLCSARVWSFRYREGRALDHRDETPFLGPGIPVTSFGEGARGELYITTHAGLVFRLALIE